MDNELSAALHTPNYVLRPLQLTDAETIYTLRSSEEVNEFLNRPLATSIDDAIIFIKKIIAMENAFYRAITIKNTGDLAGTITIYNIDPENDRAEVGYELLPQFQGKGIMKEVLHATIEFAFYKMRLKSLEGWLQEGNIKSILLLKKFGFERDIAGEKDRLEPGMNEVIYRLSAEKWKNLALPKLRI